MALFGEIYGETVRTITIMPVGAEAYDETAVEHPTALVEQLPKYSYELCGGTHLERTSDVGAFIIVSEGSAAAGGTTKGSQESQLRRVFRACCPESLPGSSDTAAPRPRPGPDV